MAGADGFVQLGLVAGVVGAVAFCVVFLVEGWLRPGYRPIYHPVSALALGPRGVIQKVNFAVNGVLVTLGAVGLRLDMAGQPAGVAAPLALAVVGLGLVASAVPMDPMRGYPEGAPAGDPEEPSWAHRTHDAAGAVVFGGAPLGAAVVAVALAAGGAWVAAVANGVLAVLLMVGAHRFTVAWEADDPLTGLWQRGFLLVAMAWVAALCTGLTR